MLLAERPFDLDFAILLGRNPYPETKFFLELEQSGRANFAAFDDCVPDFAGGRVYVTGVDDCAASWGASPHRGDEIEARGVGIAIKDGSTGRYE